MAQPTVDPSSVSQPQFGIVVEKDLDIPMRDGLRLKCDVFRPDAGGRYPAFMTLGPYPKDAHIDFGAHAEEHGPLMHFESANPEWWVPRGYVQVRVDMRGTGKSPGYCDIVSEKEAEDYYDAIEWVAQQPWSNSRVGLLGISYFAMNQWLVACLKPPALKAMIPWEGWADLYRDCAYHGGIFSDKFFRWWFWHRVVRRTLGEKNSQWREHFAPFFERLQQHPLLDDHYARRAARWDQVEVPFLSVGNWGGAGLHLRGNVEDFARAASEHKRLRLHTGSHVGPFYALEGRLDQMRFFDYWLKQMLNGLPEDPPVKLSIRVGWDEEHWRLENEWPLARTEWAPLYLSCEQGGLLTGEAPLQGEAVCYSAEGPRMEEFRGAHFTSEPMEADTEITGPINLVLWVSSSVDDMDIFATLRVLAPDGGEMCFPEIHGLPWPLSKGWLRASQRKFDAELSRPYRPYHTHDEIRLLQPGEAVQVQVEILPANCILKKGYRLRLDIQPWDDDLYAWIGHDNMQQWRGTNTIHTGGMQPSYLLLPIIPAKQS